MVKRQQGKQPARGETAELRSRLQEMEETLRAIQEYMVDAFVVNRDQGIQVVTLNGSEIPYRMMVESMNEGAVTLIPDGTIFYCNACFGRMVQKDPEELIGSSFRGLIAPEEQGMFEEIFKQAGQDSARADLALIRTKGERAPVHLSIYRLGEDKAGGLAVIVTDLSERVQSEEKIRTLASKLSLAEQEERQRLSQVLHDDLQQRLFAIKAQLSFLRDFFDSEHISAGAYSELDQIQHSLSESIAITRNLSIDLNPVMLQGEGLAEAITWLAFRMKEQYDLHIDIKVSGKFSHLEKHFRMLLFQSIRELLFNVVKHAGVLEAAVTLEQVDGHHRITVSDSGKGFDAKAVMQNLKTAHGLLLVQDRLSLLGCNTEVNSKPGEGTRIVIELPSERTSA